MKAAKTVGLALFIVGFAIFNASFFLNEYRLSNEILEQYLPETELLSWFNDSGTPIMKKSYSTNFSFIKDIKRSIAKTNEEVMMKYGINEMDIALLSKSSNSQSEFSFDYLKNNLGKDDPVMLFKIESLSDFGGWLNGISTNDADYLSNELNKVASAVNIYGILNKKGIDKYKAKDLRYNLTKASSHGPVKTHQYVFLLLTYVLCIVGAAMYILPKLSDGPAGIKNDGIFHKAMTNVGWLGILTGTYLILFYILLYFLPEYMASWIIMVDPISQFLKGSEAGRFFLYGFLYTLVILVMGVRMLIKYRHSRYQQLRTGSVMFFQTAFAFLIPEILLRLNKPYFDFKNIWPLDYDFFFDYELSGLLSSGKLGVFMLVWGIALTVVAVPVFVYFFGKRWYCSWVCGCGGLAETLGDPYRQLSNKTLKAWKVERWMIHAVLAFAIIMTVGVLYTFFTNSGSILGINTYTVREIYGVFIGAGFAGVVGTGFYPLMGNRVWCRFGCPLAAYLGIIQRFKSRFRITTNGGQCISCGNCSTYCEMGIDVRWYAQRGQNIVRSSCVGCGVCSSVCPRGVLNLENKDEKGRFGEPILIGNKGVQVRN